MASLGQKLPCECGYDEVLGFLAGSGSFRSCFPSSCAAGEQEWLPSGSAALGAPQMDGQYVVHLPTGAPSTTVPPIPANADFNTAVHQAARVPGTLASRVLSHVMYKSREPFLRAAEEESIAKRARRRISALISKSESKE